MHKKHIHWSFLIIALLGLAISIFLVKEHYGQATGFCDINAVISCALVNQSIYSEIFGIPVALLGVMWFVGLGILTFFSRKERAIEVPLLLWCALGLLSIGYFIHAEYVLGVICPWCTTVHILVLITTFLALHLYIKKRGEAHA